MSALPRLATLALMTSIVVVLGPEQDRADLPTPAPAEPRQTAKMLSERAAAHILHVGKERAFSDFSGRDGGFVDGGGWVDYLWPRPAAKRIEAKSSYVTPTDGVVCGVGHHKG